MNDTNVSTGGGIIPPSIIDPNYHTPYAIHVTAGVQHAFNANWILSTDFTLETGMHGYRRYDFPNPTFGSIAVFRSDNRSSYKALKLHLQGNIAKRLSLVANYTLSSAKTWGCVLGELFDYVNGVCNPFDPFAPGDYGPSGEDVTSRAVLVGHVPRARRLRGKFSFQAETARPITLTNADNRSRRCGWRQNHARRIPRNTLYSGRYAREPADSFQGTVTVIPFIEFFNLFNRNNPGANFVTNVAILPGERSR